MNRARQWAALVVVVALAAGLRVYELRDVPAGLFCDEAALGYNAFSLARAGVDENGKRLPLYVWSFGVAYKNPVFIYAASIPVTLLGLDEFSTRLTSALFGTGTVIAVFFLGRALYGPWVGLWAALFLAVCPWHLHFSRIAFELIAFPFLFVCGALKLVRFIQGYRSLAAALLFFSFCIYSYAIAALFVPLFLLGFAALYAPTLVRRWREVLAAGALAAVTLAPAAIFFTQQQGSGTVYFRRTTFTDRTQPWGPQFERFAQNYRQFFSPSFLVERGDPIARHAVRDFGELYTFFVPFFLLGIVLVAVERRRPGKLLLWWLVLYPVGPSLMTEIPTASRSIVGVPAICLLTGIGFAGALRGLGWLLRTRPRLAPRAQALAASAALVVLGVQVERYLRAYFTDYAAYAGPSPSGFQYGYRDMIAYMESERANYDVLMLSMTDANQPYIFPLFYNRVDPHQWLERRDPGYLVVKPEEFHRYKMGQRLLFGLHPSDVDVFSDYTVKREIVAPGGSVVFVVADVRARKQFLGNWLALGPFPNPDNTGVGKDFIDPAHPPNTPVKGAFGETGWRPAQTGAAQVDLNRYYATADPRSPGNPEWVCAYALTQVTVPTDRQAYLELGGSWGDPLRAWLDGRLLTPWPLIIANNTMRRPVTLTAGVHYLLINTCESIAYWEFAPRLVDAQGHDFTDITTTARLPPPGWEPPPEVRDTAVQLVEGFAAATDFTQHELTYPDYRGGSESWRAGIGPQTQVAWKTAPPPLAERAIFAFTASTSDERADFLLSVNGESALTFTSGPEQGARSWEGNGYKMTFLSKMGLAGNSGVVLLSVPAGRLVPGQPVELRVRPAGGDPGGWFMVKGWPDTLAHEQMPVATAVEALDGGWQVRPLAYVK